MTASPRRIASACFLVLGAVVLAGGCSNAPAAAGTYTLGFPSTAAAIATQTVQVWVYPYTSSDTCQSLVQARRTMQPAPGSPVGPPTAPVAPCKLLAGGNAIPVSSFGDYAFLAVAQFTPTGQTTPQDLLVGCAAQTISATNTNVVIPLQLASESFTVPATTCTTLSQHCGNGACP